MSTSLLLIITLTAIAAVIALTGYINYKIFKVYADNQQKSQMLQMKIDEHKEYVKTVVPIRLQAYERMTLFLERISPNSLIIRCYQPGMNLQTLQGVLTKTIRDEWEHNLSQQIYISSESWTRIREAKDEMINLINSSAISLPAEADPTTLAATIFTNVVKTKAPTDMALEFLKKEIKEQIA